MRLSSLAVAVILLFSSVVLAQHSSTSSTPSSPVPSPAPAAAPSSPPPAPAPSPSPSASSSAASSASAFHSSAPSSPSPASIPASHSSPMPSSSASHASGSSSSNGSEVRTASPTRSPTISNEGRIASSPRVGEIQPAKEKEEKEKDRKAPEPDLRRRICTNGACKEPEPNPEQGDLRRRICTNGPCPCHAGQSSGKNGNCVATAASAKSAPACQANEFWNGNSCMAGNRCQAGESWNGFECSTPGQCAMFSSRASLLAMDARSAHRDMEAACNNDPYGQQCMLSTQSYDSALLSYQMLLNEAPVSCRTLLPDPLSL